MKNARALIVDDSILLRRLVSATPAADTAIDMVGDAANGRIVPQKISPLNPDLVPQIRFGVGV